MIPDRLRSSSSTSAAGQTRTISTRTRSANPDGTSSSDNAESVFSLPLYHDLRDRDTAFTGLVARMSARITVLYRGNADPATAETVSGNFFQVLGIGASSASVSA